MTVSKPPKINPARILWQADGSPRSGEFNDIYFSKHNGLEETRYVFLENNQLSQRFTDIKNDPAASFHIGETGFGTGLNFLCAWQLRNQLSPACHLHFVSVEKFPLSRSDIETALSSWPEISTLSARLIEQYSVLTPGWHRISFIHDRVDLSLFIGDVSDAFSNIQTGIDAWFLDGFAPAKNPEMWSKDLFQNMARLSHQNTTLSTFTAAGSVREGLREAGFDIERVKGFAQKRHMIKGQFSGQRPSNTTRRQNVSTDGSTPWFITPALFPQKKRAVIIGGGLAGTSAAFSLARRGWNITLYEQHSQLACEASGNDQGVLYNKISAEPSIQSDFYTASYLYACRQLNALFAPEGPDSNNWQACGVLQLAMSENEYQRQRNILANNPLPRELAYPVTAEQASDLAGITLNSSALFFPGGGWANPQALCQRYVELPNIRIKTGTHIDHLTFSDDAWNLYDTDADLIATANIVVIANANAARQFSQTSFLPIKAIRGQTTRIPASGNDLLKTVLCGQSYITPSKDDQYQAGATFNSNNSRLDCTDEDHGLNLKRMADMAPTLTESLGLVPGMKTLAKKPLSGHVGFRASTPDYLPLIGPVPDLDQFVSDYASLRKDARLPQNKEGAYLPGLYVTSGHGSKGLTTCPIAGEILAGYLNGESMPLAKNLINAVNPSRFIIRDLIRHKL